MRGKTEVTQWVIWQMANQGPKSGECGHFRRLADTKGDQSYAVTRFTDEVNRLYGVLNKRLAHATYLGGRDYSIADIAVFPWLRSWKNQGVEMSDYPHLKGWFDEIAKRPAVQRGVEVLAGARRPLTDEKAREALFGQRQIDQR